MQAADQALTCARRGRLAMSIDLQRAHKLVIVAEAVRKHSFIWRVRDHLQGAQACQLCTESMSSPLRRRGDEFVARRPSSCSSASDHLAAFRWPVSRPACVAPSAGTSNSLKER